MHRLTLIIVETPRLEGKERGSVQREGKEGGTSMLIQSHSIALGFRKSNCMWFCFRVNGSLMKVEGEGRKGEVRESEESERFASTK
jgi:hypothetical protein